MGRKFIKTEFKSNLIEEKYKGFFEINLESLTYQRDSLDKLIAALIELKDKGLTTFSTSHKIGYYDSVEDISLEFIKQKS